MSKRGSNENLPMKFGAFYCTPTDCTEEILFAESMDAAYEAAKRRAATGVICLPEGEADELAVVVIPVCGDALSVVPELTRTTVTQRAEPVDRHWSTCPIALSRERHPSFCVQHSSDAEPACAVP